MAAPALSQLPSDAATLRRFLGERFPDSVLLPRHAAPPIPTGLEWLDAILPNGGLPRGRVVVWHSLPGGASAVLQASAAGILARGERVAWVDGARMLGPHWVDGPLVIRPKDPELALRAAEILLRSGGFALVVLTGIDPDQTAMLRLSRMVHEGAGGFVAVTSRTLGASLRLSSRYLPSDYVVAFDPFGRRARLESVALAVEARAPGWRAATTFQLPLAPFELRMALDPGLPDRRGDLRPAGTGARARGSRRRRRADRRAPAAPRSS